MFDEESNKHRWFLLPSEALACLQGHTKDVPKFNLPFCPPNFREHIGMDKFEPKDRDSLLDYSTDVNIEHETSTCDTATCDLTPVTGNLELDKQQPACGSIESSDIEIRTTAPKGCEVPVNTQNSLVKRFVNKHKITSIDIVENEDQLTEEDMQNTSVDVQPIDSESQNVCRAVDSKAEVNENSCEEGSKDVSTVPEAPSLKKRKLDPNNISDPKNMNSKETSLGENGKKETSLAAKLKQSSIQTVQDSKAKKKNKNGWFSPPKVIFNQFLKVLQTCLSFKF